MQISSYTYNNISFSRNSKEYTNGFNHEKNDGIKGNSTFVLKENTNAEYEKGYNKGYQEGKEKRNSGFSTVSDVIQDVVDKRTPRKQAIKLVSQYLGGW